MGEKTLDKELYKRLRLFETGSEVDVTHMRRRDDRREEMRRKEMIKRKYRVRDW